jgi:hypothetical protein
MRSLKAVVYIRFGIYITDHVSRDPLYFRIEPHPSPTIRGNILAEARGPVFIGVRYWARKNDSIAPGA